MLHDKDADHHAVLLRLRKVGIQTALTATASAIKFALICLLVSFGALVPRVGAAPPEGGGLHSCPGFESTPCTIQGRSGVTACLEGVGGRRVFCVPGDAPGPVAGIGDRPCDIYARAGTPCVAAHSTVRALYRDYNGPLYQVTRFQNPPYRFDRNPDGSIISNKPNPSVNLCDDPNFPLTVMIERGAGAPGCVLPADAQDLRDITVLTKGGYANGAAQEDFCAGRYCLITKIYDQSPNANHLAIEGRGGAYGHSDVGAPADALPVSAGGQRLYGVLISPGVGYRANATHGVAVRGQAEAMYIVTSGTHFNDQCCFDYGNAETSSTNTGAGHMDSVQFGSFCGSWYKYSPWPETPFSHDHPIGWTGHCFGSGPWVQADLENGSFQSNSVASFRPSNTGHREPFVTAMLKNNGQDWFALKGSNAQSGTLATEYAGPLPSFNELGGADTGYMPMRQEGAIVLGTGGDNSNGAMGSFFEGVMTAGVPSDQADDAVQANIVGVGYGGPTGKAGTLEIDSEISLRATTACCTDHYLRYQLNGGDQSAVIAPISASSSALDRADATWIVRRGLANSSCFSFEVKSRPGQFLRHRQYFLFVEPYDLLRDGSFAADSTFCREPGVSGQGDSFRASIGGYIRHYYFRGFVGNKDLSAANPWDTAASYADDVSWSVSSPWAP